ncbi:uroporphyrinogen-III synthase [Vallicoccus soli]|uniref:uroporphyrinogen-III synthase n=1 Tax=Vallicoccus soli TaxID=2339232 RepID=UPI0015B1D245|nr:uroporphyrinogen-III synthase [Vallicoccus soli]
MSVAEVPAAPAAGPLTGFTVAVTAARRRDELASLLERRGARVVSGPAIRLVPLADDTELHRATLRCLEEPVDVAVATTGIGFRGWVEAADGWGLGERLLERLGAAELLARGPKARGAIRAAGLRDAWSPDSESSTEVLEHLLARDLEGLRVAVQLHGEPLPDFVEALEAAGATVVQVPVYRWTLPEDVAPLRRLVDLVAAQQVDCVTFTSAPAVASLLRVADERGQRDAVLAALRGRVLPACVGPVTAGPLTRLGVPSLQPTRSRLGSLVREVADALPARTRALPVAGRELEVRGHAVLLDGAAVCLPPGPMAVLRALAEQPGRVLARPALRRVLTGDGADDHAVEMAVARIRTGLGDPRIVQTVVKRGYRLAHDPRPHGEDCHEEET